MVLCYVAARTGSVLRDVIGTLDSNELVVVEGGAELRYRRVDVLSTARSVTITLSSLPIRHVNVDRPAIHAER